jgi:predicted PurR-regulated permease PerM
MQGTLNTAAWRRAAWVAAGIVLVLAGLWFAAHIPRTISIFVIAAFIAFGVQPIVVRLERHMPKPLAITLVFVVLMLLIAVFFVVVVPLTISQTQALASNIPTYASAAQGWVAEGQGSLQQHFPTLHLPSFNISHISAAQLSAFIAAGVASLGAIAVNTVTGFFIAFSSIVLSFFFLLNDTQIADSFAAMFPTRKRDTARRLASEVTDVFGRYISGQVIVSAITGAVIGLATAVLGFKFSVIIGVISAIAYAIPILGMLIAQIIAVPLCVPQGIWMVVWVQVIMFGMARISDNVLVPKIMGQSVGVSPIGAMFAVFAGGELFGIPGLILGIPAAALIKILWRYFVAPRLHGASEKR